MIDTSRKNLALAACMLGAFMTTTLASAEQLANTPASKVIARCETCHGPGGNSLSGTVPRLNGQNVEYIRRRLSELQDPTREDPHATRTMGAIGHEFDTATLAAIETFFSNQLPSQPLGSRAHAAEGMKIFMNGAAAQNVPACRTCHGDNAEGNGEIPRLAGQHAIYLSNQLQRLRLSMRESPTMYHPTRAMTDAQIDAIVAFLANR